MEHIIRTKLHRPKTDRNYIRRKALLDRLNQSERNPLTLVSAPAGYGKSTLVSCWLETLDIPSAWISLDDKDDDLRLFLTYFIAAIQRISSTACDKSLSMLELDHLPPVSVLQNCLINELDQIGKRFILVLDDYYFIRNKDIHTLIAGILKLPPAFMQLVLISRIDPPLPLNSLRASGKMVEIRTMNLRFSLDDAMVLLQQITARPVSISAVEVLVEKTEGWVTGLRLTGLTLAHSQDFDRIMADLPMKNTYVMDYIVSEVLSLQPPTIQKYMLKTSILNSFCAPLCDRICFSDTEPGNDLVNGLNFVEFLNKASLFVIPLDDEQKWFRYHHLFQSVLKQKLKQQFKKEDIDRIHALAAGWFAENKMLEQAFSHAFKCSDNRTALVLMRQHRHDLIKKQHWSLLNRWMEKFPPDFVLKHVDLLLAKAWIYHRQGRYSDLFHTLERLKELLSEDQEKSDHSKAFWGEYKALESFKYYSMAEGELSGAAARKALDMLPSQYHDTRGFAILMLAASLQMIGEFDQIQGVVHDALQKDDALVPAYKIMVIAALCYTNWISGDLNSLKLSTAQLLEHGGNHDLSEAVATGCFFTGIFHYQRNELDLAEFFLLPNVSGLAANKMAIPTVINYCQSSIALSSTYQAMGRDKKASAVVETLLNFMLETGNPDLLDTCRAFQAELALRQGRVAEADFWAMSHKSGPLVPAYRFYKPCLTFPRILLARQTKQSLIESTELLSQAYHYYESIHNTCILIDILVLQALACHDGRDTPKAIEKLAKAVALAEPGGFIRPFLDQGPGVENLLGRLVKQDPGSTFALNLLKCFDEEKTDNSRDRSDAPGRNKAPSLREDIRASLTNSEIEILKVLAKGVNNPVIAKNLHISPETVKRHLSTIYSKLEVENRHQAIVRAKYIGLL